MVSEKIQEALNEQIAHEGQSSQFYLAMASWAENEGLNGVAAFLYRQSDEERQHMLKLIRYVNERGGRAEIPSINRGNQEFKTVQQIFQLLFDHETMVSQEINKLVGLTLDQKDYTTHNFLQWYVAEQIEEEALARNILDKLNLIGNDKGGLYLFDRDMENFRPIGHPSK